MLPDRRAVEFARWYRRAVRSGRLTGAEARIHGDPRRIPFPKGDRRVPGDGHGPGDRLRLRRGLAGGPDRGGQGAGGGSGGSGSRGSGDRSWTPRSRTAPPASGTSRTRRGGSRSRSRGPDRLATSSRFVRTSPLRTQDGGPAPDLRADGPASTTAELDVPYGRGAAGRKIGVSGTIALAGVALRLAGRRAVLEGVAGDLAFDAATLRGGPLRGRLRGAEIESHVEFDRDEGLRLRFSGEGGGDWFGAALEDLVALGPEETGPWLEHVQGRVSWDAEYRSRAGIVFRSDLRTASIDFPPPFEKPAGTARPLEVALAPGETEWLIDASYGADARARFEIADTGAGWALARGELTLGGVRPTLPAESHVEVSVRARRARSRPVARRRGGEVSRVERLAVPHRKDRARNRRRARSGPAHRPRPPRPHLGRRRIRRFTSGWPERDSRAKSCSPPTPPPARPARASTECISTSRWWPGKKATGSRQATIRAERSGRIDGLRSTSGSLRFASRSSTSARSGRSETGPTTGSRSRRSKSIRSACGYARKLALRRGRIPRQPVRGQAEFQGSHPSPDHRRPGRRDRGGWDGRGPLRSRMARLAARTFAGEGRGRDRKWMPRTETSRAVRVGPLGRLFALLSLEALPRVLALDLSHVVGKGFAYDRITARLRIEDGSARIRKLVIAGPSAQIEMRWQHRSRRAPVRPGGRRHSAAHPEWSVCTPPGLPPGPFWLRTSWSRRSRATRSSSTASSACDIGCTARSTIRRSSVSRPA